MTACLQPPSMSCGCQLCAHGLCNVCSLYTACCTDDMLVEWTYMAHTVCTKHHQTQVDVQQWLMSCVFESGGGGMFLPSSLLCLNTSNPPKEEHALSHNTFTLMVLMYQHWKCNLGNIRIAVCGSFTLPWRIKLMTCVHVRRYSVHFIIQKLSTC